VRGRRGGGRAAGRCVVRGCAAAPPAPPQRADTAALRRTLDALAGAHRGVVGYVVHNLDTGERLARDADAPYPTASLVKVPVLVALFDRWPRGASPSTIR
jgi:beta-lactamase class A